MLQSDQQVKWSRVWRGIGAVCGALLFLGLMWVLLIVPPHVAVGDADALEATTDLQVDKQGPDTTLVEEVITYTLLVTNNTASPLSGVILTDTWNSQVYSGTYTSSGDIVINSLVFVTEPAKYAQFNLDVLANGHGQIQMTMIVTGGLQPRYTAQPTVLGNSAVITAPGVTANTDSVNTMIVGPVLQITKTVTPTIVRPGQLFTYTFQVYNRYRMDAIVGTHVVVTEQLPNNTLFHAAFPPDIVTFFPETNIVQWELPGTLPISSSAYVSLTLQVSPTAPYGDIQNPKRYCGVQADGVPVGIPCSTDVNLRVDDAFEKVGLTISPPQQTGAYSRTFPNRIMTYTVSVYNPFAEPVTGMIVTDTLPTHNNIPEETFVYNNLLSSSAPALPTVVSQTSQIVAWELPEVQPGSVYTFAFQAFVPPQMFIDDNQIQKEYANQLSGNYAGLVLATNNGTHDNSMKTNVVRQIELIKMVAPTSQLYGLPVDYTLIVSNAGPTTIRDIQVTDILPTQSGIGWCGFRWHSFVSGQPPVLTGTNWASWSGITLTGYSQITLATFRAVVRGSGGTSCPNTVEGYSPDTYIVKRTNLSPVTVLSPFAYNKTVNPTSVVLGGQVQYTARDWNIGTELAHMDLFIDYLPSGFKYNGQSVYSETTDIWLLPGSGNSYETTFSVDVLGTPEPCDNLPKVIYQKRGSFATHIDAPPELGGNWWNGADVAGVNVLPQATAYKTLYPPGALPGGVITFTITLNNNTGSDIPSVRVTDTLPNGFVFGSILPGTPAPLAVIPPNVIWNDITIPAAGQVTLAFTATATTLVNNYQNVVKASSLTNPSICIPKYTTPAFPVKRGQIELSKLVTPKSINPLGQFQYNITLKNIGPYTVTIGRFTETLPGVPGYPWKYVSMQSGDPLPVSTDPLAWANLTLGADKSLSLRVNVRASYQVGTYPNLAPPDLPGPLAGYMTGTLPVGWVFTKTSNYNNPPPDVTVIPGVGIDKEVYPSVITLPQQSTVIYTITVVNVSPSSVNNLRITDTLPTGFVFDAWISGDLPQSTNPPLWIISSMPNATTKQFVFRARVSPQQPSGTYYNRLSLSADGLYIPPTGNLAPVKVKGVPSLNLGKEVSPDAVMSGRSVTYTLTLENPDPNEPVTARVTDTLPSGFTFAEMISGPTPLVTTPQVVWLIDNMPPETTQIISFRAFVDVNTPSGTYYNQLTGSSTQIVFPGTGPTAPVVVAQPIYDVQVSKTDASYTATIGGETIYTIRYTNTLNSLHLTAGGVVLTETFAPSDYLTADAPGWDLVSPGVYTYFVGDLPAGATGQITFGLLIDNSIPVEYYAITNTVAIDAASAVEIPEAIEQPTSNNVSVDVDLIRDVGVMIGPDQSGTACAGSQMVYTLTVSNNIAITDTINLSLQPATPIWATVVQPSALALSPYGSGLVTVTVTIPSSAAPGSTDSVTVTASGQTSGLLDRASIQTMAKIGCATCVSPGPTFTYTPAAPRVNQMITFTATATGTSPFTYTWNFGDGSAAASGNPIGHSYATVGTFQPTLTATNQCGSALYSTVIIVAANTSTITLASSVNPSVLGQTVTFTATVVPAAVTGTVQFYADGMLLAGAVAVSNGTAHISTAALSVGTHVITATYSGDATHLASTSAPLNQVVVPASTCLPITGVNFSFMPPIPTTGKPVNFTAVITGGTLPITYTWNFGHGADVVTTATSVAHSFPSTYILQTYLVTLAAVNECSSRAAAPRLVSIQPWRVYLPLILK